MGVNQKGFEKRIPAGERVLVDTSVLIAYFEPSDATHDVAVAPIDNFIKSGRNAALVSPVTAMELLVRPLKVKPATAVHVHDFLSHWPNLSLLSIDLHVAQEAASLRATHNFKTPDALVIATGIVGQVTIDESAHSSRRTHQLHLTSLNLCPFRHCATNIPGRTVGLMTGVE